MNKDFRGGEDLSEAFGREELLIGDDVVEMSKNQNDSVVGLWTRSLPLRVIVWMLMIQTVCILSLQVSSMISGYGSVFEMIHQFRISLGF
ncbi:MAG TPA: hypothetical protein DEB24_06415 [Coriobacteriia bacterium]|nr:hypothetical protein [Coriobacteriia bacterium]